MPQEAWVLKCYSCKKFQVQLKKKAKKWQCKVCNSKQDLITIYFKGSTSDCRINVQNMNAAEGEELDKQMEQTDFQDQYSDDGSIIDHIGNISLNSHESHNHSFSCEDMEEFSNSVLEADLSEQCVKSDEDYFQTSSRTYSETAAEGVPPESSTASSRELPKNDNNKEVYDFDINSINFTIKTYSASTVLSPRTRLQQQPALTSIFESNSDVDETLDF